MHLRKCSTATALALAAMILYLPPARSAAAQDADEAVAYQAWFAANQAQDTPKAMEAAAAYLKAFPSGQYADFLTKWFGPARLALLNEAIKAGQVDKILSVGREILASEPENLNVLYTLALQLRQRELLASPRSFAHGADAVEVSRKAIELVESGRTLAGVDSFDKDATLAWLYQVVAMVEAEKGDFDKAVELYGRSSALAPNDAAIAGRNLLEMLSMRQSRYASAVNAYNALPEEARGAAEPSAEVADARGKLNAEADALIDVAARFVAFADARGLPKATRDRVFSLLEGVYKSRHPDDPAGLQGLIESKKPS